MNSRIGERVMDNLTFPLARSNELWEEDPKIAKEAFHAVAEENSPKCPSCRKPVKHREGLEWCQDRQMSEKTLQDRIRDRAKRRGWEVVHIGKAVPAYDGAGNPVWVTSAPEGWPDLVLFKPTSSTPVIAMELKKQTNSPTPAQLHWLDLLNRCGIPAIVVKPIDLREGRVNAILDL
jgi:hypothetical protein